jgi:multiple sugar transport system substrate-binding protein
MHLTSLRTGSFIIAICLFLGGFAHAQTALRLSWWGGEARHAMYNDLANLFEAQNPDVMIDREFAAFGPYWERLTTQIAGGNAPDVLHMHERFLNEYVTRGALADLTPLVESGAIDLGDFSDAIIDTGRAGGRIYMITLGNSAPGTHYNTRLFTEAGVEPPPFEWTWDDLEEMAVALSEAHGSGVYGVNDAGGWPSAAEHFIRQQGTPFFAGDALGFDREALVAYWSLWQRLRAAGAIPPADVTAERDAASHPDSLLVHNIVAMQFMSGNQHKLYQQNTDDELALTTLPRSTDTGAPAGDVLGGAYIAIAAGTRHKDAAAAFVNWFVNDPEVAMIYNAEHGPPGSRAAQAVVMPQLVPADQRLSAMMEFVGRTAQASDRHPAKGGEVMAALTRIYQELSFGRYRTVEDAVDDFFEEADFILN